MPVDISNINKEMIEEHLNFEEWLLIIGIFFYLIQNYLRSTIDILMLRFVYLFVFLSISTNTSIRAMIALQCNLKSNKTRSNNVWMSDILQLRRLFGNYLAFRSMTNCPISLAWLSIYQECIQWSLIPMTRQLQF